MRSFLSRLLGFLIILLMALGLLVALLPTIVSTDWGRKQVVYWMNHSIPGNIEIRHLNLHWGKGQEIEGFLLKDPEGQAVLEFDKFSTEATLWQLLKKSPCLGFTQIQELNAAIVTNERGQTNLQRALGIHEGHKVPSLSPSTIVLSDVNIESYLFAPNHPLSAQIKGLTKQDHLNGSFEINFSLNGLWASDWRGLQRNAEKYFSSEGSKEAKIQAHIANFPVDLIDRLVALQNPQLNGLFHSLLGDRLNLNIDKEPSDEGLAFNLTLLSPLMQGDIKGIAKKDILSLKEPAIFHLNLIPQSINPLIHNQLELLKPSRLEIHFSRLVIPLDFFDKKGVADPCLFGFKAELKLPETFLDIDSIGELKVLNLQAHLTSLPCDKLVQIEVIGQAQQQSQTPFNLHFTSSINKPSNISQFTQQISQSLHSTLTISQLPLQVIPFFHKHPNWSERIGSYVNAQLEIHPKNKGEWVGVLSFQTPQIILKEAQLSIGKELSLISPAKFDWTLSPDCLQTLFDAEELSLNQPCPLNFVLKKFQMPLDDPQLTRFQVESHISNMRLPKLIKGGVAQVDDFSFKVDGVNLSQFKSNLTGQFSLLTPEGTLSPLIPDPLVFKQTSDWKVGKNGTIEMPAGQFHLQNSVTYSQINTELTPHSILELSQPLQIEYTLTPCAFEDLSRLMHQNWPALQEPTHLKLSIDPSKFDLKSFSLSDLYLQGLLEAKKIIFQDASGDSPTLGDMVIPWVIDFPRNNIYANIKGLAYSRKEGKPGQISANLQFWLTPDHYDLAHTSTEARLNFAAIPTSILNIVCGIPNLNLMIGPILDLSLKSFLDPEKEKPGYWDLVVDSTHFHVEGRFKLEGNATIYEPSKLPTFRLTVTPESYPYLKKILNFQDERQLANPFTVTGTLSNFNLPIQTSWTDRGIFDFQISTTPIQWQNIQDAAWSLEGHLATENLMKHLNFFAQVQAKTPFTVEGSLTNLFDSHSHLRHWKEMGIKASLNGQQLTPSFIQNLFPLNLDQKQKLLALFGDSFDVNASCQLQNLTGPVRASVKGMEGSIQLEGQVKEGVLTLTHPLEGVVKVTPLFTQTFLAKNVSLLSHVIGAENPITFTIEPSQFSCPLIPFQLEQMRIGKGSLNLGKLRFSNEGELSSLLNLIYPISKPYLTIWFTPIYFELDRGILSLRRFDMLVAQAYTLANWGTVNLSTHQADFVLGLSAQALHYAFGIQGLDKNYILPVPVRSAKGKVEFDRNKVATRISSLVAQAQGGAKGKLLGNILDLALSDKGEPYPPPTTQPFPWEKEFNSSPQEKESSPSSNSLPSSDSSQEINKPNEKKKRKKGKLLDDKNIKELQEGAFQLFDQWLNH